MRFAVAITVLLAMAALVVCANANLAVVFTGARMPYAMSGHQALYDGQDSVYLIGQYGNNAEVLKFSLSSQTFSSVGRFTSTNEGSAALTADGNILYFGGAYFAQSTSSVWINSFSTARGNYSGLKEMPLSMKSTGLTWDASSQVAHLFGGRIGTAISNKVYRYDYGTNQLKQIGQIPSTVERATAVWGNDGKAYVFGGNGGKSAIRQWDPVTGNGTVLAARVQGEAYDSCGVNINGFIYVAGKAYMNRFDPATLTTEVVPVDNYPTYNFGLTCAYVPAASRLYVFGGKGVTFLDDRQGSMDVYYIDFSSVA